MLRKRRGQSVGEYAVIMAVVIGAAVAMQVYIKRGLQAKIKNGTDAYTGIGTTIAQVGGGASDVTVGTTSQYEPYYLESSYDRYQETVEQEHLGGGTVKKEKVSDLSATKAGGYQRQAGATNQEARDALWEGTAPAP